MDKWLCPICKSEIDCWYIEPERAYSINYSGQVVRNDNKDAFQQIPEFQFLCSNDKEHDIYTDNEKYLEWRKEFIEEVIKIMTLENKEYYKITT